MLIDNANLYLQVLFCTSITFMCTALGSAFVFFTKKISNKFKQITLGFAAGIMFAASIWSLIIPSIEMSKNSNIYEWLPAVIGIIVGTLFLFGLDKLFIYFQNRKKIINKKNLNTKIGLSKKSKLLLIVITIHNFPEGMAVALSVIVSMKTNNENFLSFLPLMIGIGLQNIPEGSAVSFALRENNVSRFKCFLYGSLSGIIEPIGGIISVLMVEFVNDILPYVLSFSAGAMICVVINELTPEFCNIDNLKKNKSNFIGTLTFIIGFLLMMVLDIGLS